MPELELAGIEVRLTPRLVADVIAWTTRPTHGTIRYMSMPTNEVDSVPVECPRCRTRFAFKPEFYSCAAVCPSCGPLKPDLRCGSCGSIFPSGVERKDYHYCPRCPREEPIAIWERRTGDRFDSVVGALYMLLRLRRESPSQPWLRMASTFAEDFPLEMPPREQTAEFLAAPGEEGLLAALAFGSSSVYRDPGELAAHVAGAAEGAGSKPAEVRRKALWALLGSAVPFALGNTPAQHRCPDDLVVAVCQVAPFAPAGAGPLLRRIESDSPEPARSPLKAERVAVSAAKAAVQRRQVPDEAGVRDFFLPGARNVEVRTALLLSGFLAGSFYGAYLLHELFPDMRADLLNLVRWTNSTDLGTGALGELSYFTTFFRFHLGAVLV